MHVVRQGGSTAGCVVVKDRSVYDFYLSRYVRRRVEAFDAEQMQ